MKNMENKMRNNLCKSTIKASIGGSRLNRKKRYTLVTILIMVFIFIQSALPADLSARESGLISGFLAGLLNLDAEKVSFIIRKCAHFTEYLALGISLFLTMGEYLAPYPDGSLAPSTRPVFWSAWGIGTLYAITDEIHQIYSSGRSCEFRDICIDCAGVLAGILLVRLITMIAQKSKAG